MARLPRCYECEKFDFDSASCDKYQQGIPNDVLNETILCSEYHENQEEIYPDDDYPIASGR